MKKKSLPKAESPSPKIESQNQSIEWRAAEYRYVKKGPFWYFVISVIALFLVVIALFQKNFFFALFIVITVAVVFYFSGRRPQVIDFLIDEEGVRIGKSTFYSYDNLEGFAIVERPGQLNELVVKRKTTFNPYVRIPVDSQLSLRVRSFLLQKLNEISYEPSIIDLLADWLGF